MLLLTTVLWGLSFPLAKAVGTAQSNALTTDGSVITWFFSAVMLGFRFALAAAILTPTSVRALRSLTRQELWQGLGLGVFCGAGMLLQLDGLNYTSASSAAFFTSCYAVVIPVLVALQRRRVPSASVLVSIGLVLVGTAVLAGISPRELRLGRGELENLVAAGFFAVQIVLLEQPAFRNNRTGPTTVVMFASAAAINLPVLLAAARGPGEILRALVASPAALVLSVVLTLLCTVCAFTLMNHWQRELEATEAGLIYCAEPVCAALVSLFLPGLLAAWIGIDYPNEHLTTRLLVGGGLITLANALIQLRRRGNRPL